MAERPISPVTMTLCDGQERKFLLSLGGLKRIKEQLKLATLRDVFEMDAVDAGIPLLWEALLDKGDLTQQQFADLIPADIEHVTRTIVQLMGASLPEKNPTLPPPVETAAVN